jgi:hypothetical protein|tara:strand:+ start:84 stop:302 length:219 start_codon:yes stop_codon:yes gene_type:complete
LSNIIYLDDYRKHLPEDEPELVNPIVIGWDGEGPEGSLYIASTVDTDECLWMIDLAKKIIENQSSDVMNNNE